MDDAIIISNIEVWTRIGCTPEERSWPQKMHISLNLATNVRSVAEADSLTGAIDYALVCEDVRRLAGDSERVTVERFVTDIADAVLTKYQPIGVRVSARKYALPGVESVSVEILRERKKNAG